MELDEKEYWRSKCEVCVDAVVEANRAALLERSKVGVRKYGQTMEQNPGDLEYWLNHALEEALDFVNYLRAAIMKIQKEKTSV